MLWLPSTIFETTQPLLSHTMEYAWAKHLADTRISPHVKIEAITKRYKIEDHVVDSTDDIVIEYYYFVADTVPLRIKTPYNDMFEEEEYMVLDEDMQEEVIFDSKVE